MVLGIGIADKNAPFPFLAIYIKFSNANGVYTADGLARKVKSVLLKAIRSRPEPSGAVRTPPGAVRTPPGAARTPPGAVWTPS